MKVERFESDDETLLGEVMFDENVGTVVMVLAPASALNGEPGPVVFPTIDHDRTVVAWSAEHLALQFGKVDTIAARLNLYGQLAWFSHVAAAKAQEEGFQ